MSTASFATRAVILFAATSILSARAEAQIVWPPPPDVDLFGTVVADSGCGMVFQERETGSRIRLDSYVDTNTGTSLGVGDFARLSGQSVFGFCISACADIDACAGYMEIEYLGEAPIPFCFGDGSMVGCPCGNDASPGAGSGCENSTGVGATLSSEGPPFVGGTDFFMIVEDARASNPALLVSGGSETAVPFKDGILCAGAPTDRLEVLSLDASGRAETTSDIATDDGVVPGEQRVYQVWYRDPVIGPCGTGSNFTNALRVTWN